MFSKLMKKIGYKFESTLSKGTMAIIYWLSFITLFLSLLFGSIFFLTNKSNTNFWESNWQVFLHTIDTGAIQNPIDEKNPWSTKPVNRIILLSITLIGLFIFSALIGVLTTGLDKALTNIRKGKSIVLEKDFTLILGWSHTIIKIISELVLANANQKNMHIVILADKDKIEMEDEIRQKVNQKELLKDAYPATYKKMHHTHIVCRTGHPLDLDDLKIVQPDLAKSIIIIPPDNEDPDSAVIKCILALKNLKTKGHVISELKNKTNYETLNSLFGSEIGNIYKFIPSFDWLSKITAQTSQQSGYSQVLSELLSHKGNEIYLSDPPKELINFSFQSALLRTEDRIIIGLKRNNKIIINPLSGFDSTDLDMKIEEGDKWITIQEDDNDADNSNPVKLNNYVIPEWKSGEKVKSNAVVKSHKTNILIIGINDRLQNIIEELSNYIQENLVLTVFADSDELDISINAIKSNVRNNVELIHLHGDTTSRNSLNNLNLEKFESIIILGYQKLSIQERDAKSILSLLHINKILGVKKKNVVVEMYDERNRRIIQGGNLCDFIISDNIVSSLISQVSEQPDLFAVFLDLFNNEGCEIYLRSIDQYIDRSREVRFIDLMREAGRRQEIAIGYTCNTDDSVIENTKVILNPDKNKVMNINTSYKLIVIGSDN